MFGEKNNNNTNRSKNKTGLIAKFGSFIEHVVHVKKYL